MQPNYTYWRAAHPLIYIGLHLLGGSWIAAYLTPTYLPTIGWLTIPFGLSLLLFMLVSKQNANLFTVLFISLCIIYWGWAIAICRSKMIPINTEFEVIELLRNGVIEKIKKTLPHQETQGFALAILLGVKSTMDKSLVHAYLQLGIIHIIAISGMHLEILFVNLKRIAQFFPKNKIFQFIELISLLTIVWLYTFMAFASPSIVRASLIFSIYTVGKTLGAKSFTFNSIAAGICIAFLFSKEGIHSIGLQLSYAAVIGIHLIYKPLFKSIPIGNPLIRFMWSNGCMSVSTLITTLPILLFHFKQFAAWSLVSNFMLIPLSNLLLYSLAVLLLIPIYAPISFPLGRFIDNYIGWMNQFIQDWYLSTKAGSIAVSMQIPAIILYYTILLFVYLWLLQKKSSWFLGILILLTVYFLLKLFS